VIGCEFACIFATLGVRVTLVDKRERLLPFVDREITDALRSPGSRSSATTAACSS